MNINSIIKKAMISYDIPPKYFSFLKNNVIEDYSESPIRVLTVHDIIEVWDASKTRKMEKEEEKYKRK